MSRQRRSRHTVTFTDGSQSVILAYAGQDHLIIGHYAMRGKSVTRIQKGDLINGTTTGRPKAQSWAFNQAAIDDACLLLGITRPVKLRTHARIGGTMGNYNLKFPRNAGTASVQPYHDVMIKSYLSPEEASETLWHELQHAAQADRYDTVQEWWKFTREQRRYPYSIRPIEVEARQTADTMKSILLTKAL